MKRRLTVYFTLAYVFLGLQIISYLGGAASKEKIPEDSAERLGYLIGSHFFTILSCTFFISAFQLKKKIKKKENDEKIDSIGNKE